MKTLLLAVPLVGLLALAGCDRSGNGTDREEYCEENPDSRLCAVIDKVEDRDWPAEPSE